MTNMRPWVDMRLGENMLYASPATATEEFLNSIPYAMPVQKKLPVSRLEDHISQVHMKLEALTVQCRGCLTGMVVSTEQTSCKRVVPSMHFSL